MPFSPKSLEEKPYNMCLNCAYIGKHCDGPNFLAMELPRLCEWCRLRKDYLHNLDPKWTNAYIAEQAGMSKVSVDRFISGNVDDIKASTISRILKVLVNGTWGQYPCAMAGNQEAETVYVDNPDLLERLNKADIECHRLQAALDKISDERKADIAAAHSDDQKKIDFLKERIKFLDDQIKTKDKLLDERHDFLALKDKTIRLLAALLIIAVSVIVFAVVIDRLNSDMGFFWIDRMSAIFDGNPETTNHIIRLKL